MKIVAVKLRFVEGGNVKRYGFSTAPYYADASDLEGGCWFPLLLPDISLSIGISTEFEPGITNTFGSIRIVDGGDSVVASIANRLASAQVSGILCETRRGEDTDTWANLEKWSKTRSDRLSYRNRTLTITQQAYPDWLDKPIPSEVFIDTPNRNLINQSVPRSVGEIFQYGGLIFDGPRLIWYLSKDMAVLRGAAEGGAPISEFRELEWGAQLTANPNLAMVFDFAGPALENASQTVIIDQDFTSWTAGEPDGITVEDIAGVSSITDSGGGVAAVSVASTPDADTGFLAFTTGTAESRVFSDGSVAWSASSGTLFDSIKTSDGVTADVLPDLISDRLRIRGLDTTVPDDSYVTGIEVELTHSGSNVSIVSCTVIDNTGIAAAFFESADFGAVPGTSGTSTAGGSTDRGSATGLIQGSDLTSAGIELIVGADGASPTYSLDLIRIKVHYANSQRDLRLYFDDLLTDGQIYQLDMTYSSADIELSWSTVNAVGDTVAPLLDPFSQDEAKLENSGSLRARFRADDEIFAMQFRNGSTNLSSIKVTQINDSVNRYDEIIPWLVGQVGGDVSELDTTKLTAHATACGDPIMGWLFIGGETMAQVMDLFACDSLGGWWVVDRLGIMSSGLLQPPTNTGTTIDSSKIDEKNGTMDTWAPVKRTLRAVGAKNWTPIDIGNVAGIVTTFTQTDRASITEQFRVRRRADPNNLDAWPVA